MEKKELNEKELQDVSGGNDNVYMINCKKCGALIDKRTLDFKPIDEDCKKKIEYQCPKCHEWVEID